MKRLSLLVCLGGWCLVGCSGVLDPIEGVVVQDGGPETAAGGSAGTGGSSGAAGAKGGAAGAIGGAAGAMGGAAGAIGGAAGTAGTSTGGSAGTGGACTQWVADGPVIRLGGEVGWNRTKPLLAFVSQDGSRVAVGAAEVDDDPFTTQVRLASFQPWSAWPNQVIAPSVASSVECLCDPPTLVLAPGISDSHVALAVQDDCCTVPAQFYFAPDVGTDDGIAQGDGLLTLNQTEPPGPAQFLTRGTGRHLTGYGYASGGSQRLALAQYLDNSKQISPLATLGCGTKALVSDAVASGDGFIVGFSTSRSFGTCLDPSGKDDLPGKLLLAWVGPPGGGFGQLAALVDTKDDYVWSLRMVSHSKGAWVVSRYAGANAETQPPPNFRRVGTSGEVLLDPKPFGVTGCTALKAVGQSGDKLVIVEQDTCDPSINNPLLLSLYRDDGVLESGVSVEAVGGGPLDNVAVLGSPAGDRLLVAWNEPDQTTKKREVYLKRLRCGDTPNCGVCHALEDCWNGMCIAKTVKLPSGFGIDATEVTRSQYQAWLSTNPSTAQQPAACVWNTDFAPDATCLSGESVCNGTDCWSHPQVCVDECDARAYCSALGKHLCGAIGGGTLSPVYQSDATKSEWFNACSSGGVNEFIYGNGSQPGACNDYLTFTTTTVPCGSLTTCQSSVAGYAGVFDLIGNAWEWEDNCNPVTANPAEDICQPRGFSFGMGAAMPECSGTTYAKRAEPSDNVGFRCCSSP